MELASGDIHWAENKALVCWTTQLWFIFAAYGAHAIVSYRELRLLIYFDHVICANQFFNIHLFYQCVDIRWLSQIFVPGKSDRPSGRFAWLRDLNTDWHSRLWATDFTDVVVIGVKFFDFDLGAALNACVHFLNIAIATLGRIIVISLA